MKLDDVVLPIQEKLVSGLVEYEAIVIKLLIKANDTLEAILAELRKVPDFKQEEDLVHYHDQEAPCPNCSGVKISIRPSAKGNVYVCQSCEYFWLLWP